MPSRAEEINLEADKSAYKSIIGFYKKILALRKSSDVIKYGNFKDLTQGDDCFVFEREKNGEKIIVAVNFEKANSLKLPSCLTGENFELLLCNYDVKDDFAPDFAPYEIRVYRKR